jgi:hypothetical protein
MQSTARRTEALIPGLEDPSKGDLKVMSLIRLKRLGRVVRAFVSFSLHPHMPSPSHNRQVTACWY